MAKKKMTIAEKRKAASGSKSVKSRVAQRTTRGLIEGIKVKKRKTIGQKRKAASDSKSVSTRKAQRTISGLQESIARKLKGIDATHKKLDKLINSMGL